MKNYCTQVVFTPVPLPSEETNSLAYSQKGPGKEKKYLKCIIRKQACAGAANLAPFHFFPPPSHGCLTWCWRTAAPH